MEAFASLFKVFVFSENETGRGRQVGVGPFQKKVVWCKTFYSVTGCHTISVSLEESVWRTKVTLRVAFLGCSATLENLQKRRIIVVDWCFMCKMNREFVDHLLLHYEIACAIWNVFFSRLGMSWIL
jgi:hypothetical protein